MNKIRFKLLLGIALVVFFSQIISAITIWHESIEHIEIMLNADLDDYDRDKKVNHEIREIVLSIILITGSSLFFSFIIIYTIVTQLTIPLEKLVLQLQKKDTQHFKPITIDMPQGEMTLVKETINELLFKIKARFEREMRFTSDVAHELRTPLAGLRLHLELMSKTDPNINKLIIRIDNMMSSIELLFRLARTEERFFNGQLEEIDLIKNLILPLKLEYEDKLYDKNKISIIWTYPEMCMLKADAGLLLIALRNLIDNAIKHGQLTELIEVKLHIKNEFITLQVLDDGIGIDSQKLASLSLRYDPIDIQNKKGWGIGLNLVKRIVQAHLGELEIKNLENGRNGLFVSINIPNRIDENSTL